MLWLILSAKFLEDTSTSEKVVHTRSFSCTAVIRYSAPITTVPINEQLLGAKMTCAQFQTNISKTIERLVRIYTNAQTDGHGEINSTRHADLSYKHFIECS